MNVVMFSGGLGSYLAAKRIVNEGPMTLLFADVKGNSTDPHSGEDQDTYRFLEETSADLGC